VNGNVLSTHQRSQSVEPNESESQPLVVCQQNTQVTCQSPLSLQVSCLLRASLRLIVGEFAWPFFLLRALHNPPPGTPSEIQKDITRARGCAMRHNTCVFIMRGNIASITVLFPPPPSPPPGPPPFHWPLAPRLLPPSRFLYLLNSPPAPSSPLLQPPGPLPPLPCNPSCRPRSGHKHAPLQPAGQCRRCWTPRTRAAV
jgi:hypothetical protein